MPVCSPCPRVSHCALSQMRPALSDLLQIVLCNRAASYMALNKPIPALADAQRAAACDPTNWKAHWRTGLSLMMMAPRLERSLNVSHGLKNLSGRPAP